MCKSPKNTKENRDKINCKNNWWENIDSLNINLFDIQLVDIVKENVIKDLSDPYSYVVLLTGRREMFLKNVISILEHHKVPPFNRYLFNNAIDTKQFKIREMIELYNTFPNVEEVILWEDRIEHIPSFKEVGNQFNKFTLNYIKDYELQN